LTNHLYDSSLSHFDVLARRLQEFRCKAENYAVVIYAGDNGVSTEGMSRYQPMDSSSIVISHLLKKAPTALFLERIGCPQIIVDIGLYNSVKHPALIDFNIRKGSRNFLYEDALTPSEVEQALLVGKKLWERICPDSLDIIGIGEIGIGDTLCAAAIASALTGSPPNAMTGRGSSDNKKINQKADIIDKAMQRRCPEANFMDLLCRFGGLEIAGLTGFMLEAADRGVPIMLDGYVTAVAALLAHTIDERVGRGVIAPGLSWERGHRTVLEKLGVSPVLGLKINYGEGLLSAIGLLTAELALSFYNN
jgi:nicotinate-nucleotide--dimethylbenzimidazole phosphoribosyltransferase